MFKPPVLAFTRFAILGAALLAAGCNKKSATLPSPGPAVPTPLAAAPPPAPPPPVEPNSFVEVTAQLDRGGSLFFYLSTEAWLAGLSQQIAALSGFAASALPAGQGGPSPQDTTRFFAVLTNLIKKSGLEDVTGLGASSLAIERGVYRNKLFVHHPARKSDGFLWSVFGKTAHPLRALDLLPADTALANFTDLDLAQLVALVRQEIAQNGTPEMKRGLEQALLQFSAATGAPLDEVLQSLGGSIGLILTLDPAKAVAVPIGAQQLSISAPRLALVLQVKDDRIFQLLEKTLAANPALVRVDEADLRLRSMPMPILPQLALRPTLARWGDYLAIASDETLIRDIIAAQKSGRGWKASAEFARLSEGMPTEGNSFQLANQRFAETWNRLQSEMMKNQPAATPQQKAMMEKLLAWQKSAVTFAVSAQTPTGLLVVGKGTQGGGQLLAPLLIVPAAVAAGVALPVFGKVQERGTATKSLSNAKQIGTACRLYAVDNSGKFPPTLEDLVPDYLPDAKIFASPFAPDVPMGFSYTAGLSDTSPAGTVLLEDKFSLQKKMRIVVRVDTSGEVIPVR